MQYISPVHDARKAPPGVENVHGTNDIRGIRALAACAIYYTKLFFLPFVPPA